MTRQVRTLVLVGFALLVGSCAQYERAGGRSSSGVVPGPGLASAEKSSSAVASGPGLASGNYYCSSPSQVVNQPSYPSYQECQNNLDASCTAFCNSNPQWFFKPGTGEGCGYWGGILGYCVCQIDCVEKAACPTFPSTCLANTCSGNNVAYNSEDQPCEEFCIGWGVRNCFILDGPLVPCSYYGKNACMCGQTVGITQGCTPIPPDGGLPD